MKLVRVSLRLRNGVSVEVMWSACNGSLASDEGLDEMGTGRLCLAATHKILSLRFGAKPAVFFIIAGQVWLRPVYQSSTSLTSSFWSCGIRSIALFGHAESGFS